MSGGGGSLLNFKVVGGTIEPVSPSENMIWINTDVKITEHIFSAEQPETATEGTVWICNGTFSNAEFNALKKNCIDVYPLLVRQYVNGVWYSKPAICYQDGIPVELTPYLLKGKEQNINITNGWIHNKNYTLWGSASKTAATAGENGLVFPNNDSIMSTGDKIDLTPYTTLNFLFSAIKTEVTVSVLSKTSGAMTSNRVAGKNIKTSGQTSLDISTVEGEYYIVVGSGLNTTATLNEVWLE